MCVSDINYSLSKNLLFPSLLLLITKVITRQQRVSASRKRVLSGHSLNSTEIPQIISACSQTTISVTVMFLLSEQAEIHSQV